MDDSPSLAQLLVAHRGWARRYPENTRAALVGAIEAGAVYVELDVHLTADGVPVLFHDRDFERMCGPGISGGIADHPAAELEGLSVHEPGKFGERYRGEPIMRLDALESVLAHGQGVQAFVEIKRAALERHGTDLVLRRVLEAIAPVIADCTLISFDYGVLAAARAQAPGVRVGPVLTHWEDLAGAEVQALASDVVFCDADLLPPGALAAGLPPIVVYEVDQPDVARGLWARGVQRVETFAFGELLAALEDGASR